MNNTNKLRHATLFLMCLTAAGCSSEQPTVYVTSSGTYDLSARKIDDNVNLSAAKTMGYVTFVGNDHEEEVFTGGFAGADFQPGTKDAILNSGIGPTTYEFGPVFGRDIINNLPANSHITRPQGEVIFNSLTITENRLWFQRSNKDLIITLLGTPQTIHLSNWYGAYEGAQVIRFRLANGLKLDLEVEDLVNAMTKYADDNASFDPQKIDHMPSDSNLQRLIAKTWHH